MSVIGVLTYLMILIVLVFFHELGHFLFAKLFRMKVEEFSIGIGNPKLRLFYDGQTEYNLRALPFGGFVRIKGMEIEDAVESRMTGASHPKIPAPEPVPTGAVLSQNTEPSPVVPAPDAVAPAHEPSGFETTNLSSLAQETAEVSGKDPDGFNSRPIYQRFWVILGGPLFSFLLGWLVFCLIGATLGLPNKRPTNVIAEVAKGQPAARAGLAKGDRILAINAEPVTNGEAMVATLHNSAGKPLVLSVRDAKGVARSVSVTPVSAPDPEGKRPSIGLIGIVPGEEVELAKRVSLPESFAFGNHITGVWFNTMRALFARPKDLGRSVGGPIEILKASNKASQEGPVSVVFLMAQLSLSLGLFNLIPIPILDGGHLALMGVEAVRGRKLSVDQTNIVFMVGFALIGALVVFIVGRGLLGMIHFGK